MSSKAARAGAQQDPEPQEGVAIPPPSSEKTAAKFDLSIALTLSTWSALTLAVQNSWGGPDSAEKRDWFAGVISDLFQNTPDADVDYLEEFLLQVMNDEFEINVDDDSGAEIAAKIVGLRKMTLEGDFRLVDAMYSQWVERQKKGGDKVKMQHIISNDEDYDTEWDSGDGESEDGEEEDVDMDEAPTLVKAPREKIRPKVDDEGFTEVIGKKRR
ncbi:MAG: hypothetical protein Q9191_004886 [Dirinaria sp. TL-2023a]